MARESKQRKSAVPVAYLGVWQQWARWGSILRTVAEPESTTAKPVAPDWMPVRQVVGAFQSFAESEKLRLQQLLHQSDQRLAPLSDPLWLSVRNHRWLDLNREREESYTDWLAWLLQEMDSTEAVLKTFGLDDTDFGVRVRGVRPQVDREESIRGCSGENKRLDLVIRFGEIGILIVEAKVRSIEEAGGSGNLQVYLDWLKAQGPAAGHAILLVPELIESPCDGWDVRAWDEVGLRLRAQAMAIREAIPNGLLLAAMFLCFAGAVEQNVLGLAGAKGPSVAPQTALYLERFLGEN